MNGAINSITKKYIQAWTIDTDPSYQFPKDELWLLDSNDVESYDKEKVKDITNIEVRYRNGTESVINWKGTEYSIAPCFFIPNKTELGINIIPESKEHKLAKNWIYNRIKNKSLSFIFSTVTRPWDYDNQIGINQLDVDYEKVGIEVVVKNTKTQRADIIIPLKNYHKFFGAGIIIEIQFSKQYNETTEKRNRDWAFKGYSIAWLFAEDFDNVSSEIIELKQDKIKLETLEKLMYDIQEKRLNDLREKTQLLSRMIDSKMDELNYPFCIGECKKCNSGYMTKKKIKRGSKAGNYFYGCSNFPECRHAIFLEDDSN
jgi:hypothetical protein